MAEPAPVQMAEPAPVQLPEQVPEQTLEQTPEQDSGIDTSPVNHHLMASILDGLRCPVSREAFNSEGLQRPCMLPCGHAISIESLQAVRSPTR